MPKPTKGGRKLRAWREAQQPRVSQREVAEWLPSNYGTRRTKTAAMVALYEQGRYSLSLADRMTVSERTGIPLADLLQPEEIRFFQRGASMLESGAVAA